jgi:hypothetical protein
MSVSIVEKSFSLCFFSAFCGKARRGVGYIQIAQGLELADFGHQSGVVDQVVETPSGEYLYFFSRPLSTVSILSMSEFPWREGTTFRESRLP